MNSEIILCSGIKLDRNYENVLSYSEESMVSLCRTNAIYTGTKYKIVGVRDNYINVSAKYEDCIYANYMAFINPRYGNKWFFAWVTDVKLLNPDTTQITFKVDVFSTWYSRFNVGQAFIEREHVDDDTIGKHTVPENVEMGEYVVNYENKKKELTPLNLILASNVDTSCHYDNDSGKWVLDGGTVGGGIYNGIRTGFKYYHFANDTTSSINNVIQAIDNDGKADSVVAMFLAPFSSFTKDDDTILDNGVVKQTTTPKTLSWINNNAGDVYPTKLSTLNGYTPKNNKLFTFPFCYLRVTNNNGNDAIYHFEKFVNTLGDDNCRFDIDCAICPGMSIILVPLNYDGIAKNYNQCLQAGKYPICGWASDSYTNWLTQNSVNIVTSLAGSGVSVVSGAVALGTGNVAGLSGVLSGASGIANTLGTIYQHSLTPMEAKGNSNTGDVKTSADINTFTAYGMSIKKEMAEIIDKYFSRFGYQVNMVKEPRLESRSKFNFIKVGGMDELISGNIPANDLEEINGIFRKGVTIFHNYNDIGNYTISNPIVPIQ